jgi:glycosyltransferase involved in cell wall biosynthesis
LKNKYPNLRIALLAGTLGQGGAEKQLVYMATSLQRVNVDVRVYCLTRGDFYEAPLRAAGLDPIWVGRFRNPLARLCALAVAFARFRPHIVQTMHSFTNPYAAGAARVCGAMSIGSVRGDFQFEWNESGKWSPWLFRLPSVLLANSKAGAANATKLGNVHSPVRVLTNAIDLPDFDRRIGSAARRPAESPAQILMVGHLTEPKRVDRFLKTLARVRNQRPSLSGVIVGDGPLLGRLESLASALGLLPDGVRFAGRRDDVPALMHQSSMLVCTSDHEGFANVLLEAMAARLPIVTTPAGDAGQVVQDGQTGYVVDFEDTDGMAERILRLADSEDLRLRLGEAGRRRVEKEYGIGSLAGRLLATYRGFAEDSGNRVIASLVGRVAGATSTAPLSAPEAGYLAS